MSGRAAIEYAGEVVGRPGDRRTWSGRGRVGFPSQASRSAPPGLVEVETEAEELDRNVCRTEALAGTTTVRTAEHEVRFTYDGASDCDETSTALLAIDDIEQAPLTGVMCSTLRRTEEPSHTTTSTCLLVACLCLLRVARRRSEGRRGARTQRS